MRPRWYFFAWFAVVAAVHLLTEGWTDTTAIGLPVGFAATLVLVFVPRLPRWVTGVERPERVRPSRVSTARRRLAAWTAALWLVVLLAVTAEVAAIVLDGGWLPWLVPVPALLVVLGFAGRRGEVAVPARCLASGTWTPVAAAAFDVRPGEPVDGWAVLPGDERITFHLPAVTSPPSWRTGDGSGWRAGLRWTSSWVSRTATATSSGASDGAGVGVKTRLPPLPVSGRLPP
ncbi:hypothetical protein [Amycolatopsis nalaikhensis]|uniref:Integral membrane protein n=1 Tax=Amycolatopsis nalaikhensis TaxID=715472 RepID=A0ABY8XXZ1_9PSEU|nr:hypothetical protein [Amycolatopsis sp. 2-2]WIV60478.1 hypothetical protein QP939_18645 [Amycolatopsis sp. 2-2]